MIEKALEIAKKKAQAVEISVSRSESNSAEYEDDKLKKVHVAQATNLNVRVIVDGKLGTAYSTNPDDAETVVARAIELAEFGSDAPFDFPAPADATDVKLYDPSVPKTGKEELVALGAEMLDAIKAYNSEIKVAGGADWAVGERRLINSNGLDISDRGSSFGIGVYGNWVRGTDMLFAGHTHNWRSKNADAKTVAAETIELFRNAERTASLESKQMPIIFTPQGCYVFFMALLMGVDGKNVLKGESPLTGRIGEKIAVDTFSLIDDGTLDFAPASGRYDGEGTPRQRLAIIRNGVLQAFLYDLETAAKARVHSTGHGPGRNASNTLILPGTTTTAEMVRNTKEGLLVEEMLGLGQSNIINGDFSVNISLGYKIENGEIVGRVKDAMLSGNVYDALKKIDAIGSDPDWSGSHCAPAIRVDSLSVTAKG